jgi:hypothetical protein
LHVPEKRILSRGDKKGHSAVRWISGGSAGKSRKLVLSLEPLLFSASTASPATVLAASLSSSAIIATVNGRHEKWI